FAVAGIGALFTATVRIPITAIALAIEITANYEQILALLLTCAAATIVPELLGGEPIYSVFLKRALARKTSPRLLGRTGRSRRIYVIRLWISGPRVKHESDRPRGANRPSDSRAQNGGDNRCRC
ncbi:MAG TPA: hypothetical protein DEP35_22885, partial [Deltaproteobacteria bacterium]|nr:hypothetical protein [Deltaproteobacteria bacterium]